MSDFVDWPFFDAQHRSLRETTQQWARSHLNSLPHDDVDVYAACRARVASLAAAGILRYCVPAQYGGALENLDSRALCLIRETLAYHDGLADFAFAMQGLGSGAITLAGSDGQKSLLSQVVNGKAIMAFALSEPDAGSDVAAMSCQARRDGDAWIINGTKTWISNGGIADYYTVFARGADAPDSKRSARGINAFVVPADASGLSIAERIDVIAPHPLARITFDRCCVSDSARIGAEGEGFALAMATLDIFRASVAAAALGFGQRALDEALTHVRGRRMFGTRLADMQMTQSKLADMATALDAARLLTYRAAWLRDAGHARTTKEAAMAKMAATEVAQQVIDAAVQLFGARGVERGSAVEHLYREIRALRIYEGATEVQKLIIARELLSE